MDWKALDVVHPDAAGIDVGGSEHWVAVSPLRGVDGADAVGAGRVLRGMKATKVA